MKKHISTIIAVLALGIAIVSQFRISGLVSEIQRMGNRFNNSISMMESNQTAAISHMREMLEKEASIITYTAFSLDELDLMNKSFVLNSNVTPKEYQPGLTKAFLTVNGKAYPMELTNGSYTVQIDLPLFEEVSVRKVRIWRMTCLVSAICLKRSVMLTEIFFTKQMRMIIDDRSGCPVI